MRRRSIYRKYTAWTTLLALMVSLVWPGMAFGFTETSRTGSTEQVAEGVTVETVKIQTSDGPLNVFVTRVDLSNPYVKVDTLVGKNGIVTKNQTVTNMARETGAVAAINGDFFQMKENAPIGITVQSGQVVTSPALTVSMSAFGLTRDNRPVFTRFAFLGTVTAPNGAQFQLSGINKPTYLVADNANSDTNRLNMYTPRWGEKSRGALPGLSGVVEAVVENNTVKEIRTDQPGTVIPWNGFVLAGHGTAAQFLTANLKVGDQVQVDYMVSPETDNLAAAVGGQTILVENGQRHWFSYDIPGKLARTAIGASQDGKTLFLVVADGGKSSRGMTLEEMADFMISIGAWNALNLDGGGSSTMAVRHLGDTQASLLNTPVYGSERSLPTGVGIFTTAPPGAPAGLVISGPKLILVGTKKPFAAKGYDEHYNPYTVPPAAVSWQISPDLGVFEGNTLTPLKSGDGVVRAVYGGVSGEYPVKILGSSDISQVEVSPSAISVHPGDSVDFSVRVTTRQGAVFTLQPDEYEVQLKGDLGTVSGNRFTAADRAGVGEMTVRIDSTMVAVRVTVGSVEKPLYGFEAARNMHFRSYPAGKIPGSFRLTDPAEPTFRGAGAARLEYDFTGSGGTRAAYGAFDGGLTLPGTPLGLGLWVLGDGGNGHWLRARVLDGSGNEKLLDFARRVDWRGWKYVTADIPAGIALPVKLTDIYLVETADGVRDKGVIYLDELTVKTAPAEGETVVQPPAALTAEKEITAGVPVAMELGPDLTLAFLTGAGSAAYTVTAQQVWKTELPTPGHHPVLPLFRVTGTVNGDDARVMPGYMKLKVRINNIADLRQARLMLWDEAAGRWLAVPGRADAKTGTYTAKTDRLGLFSLMEDVRPAPVFRDTENSWARDLISDMAARKIVSGYADGTFLPAKPVTRAEFITLLANTLGWAAEDSAVGFADNIPAWARWAIGAAVNRGVVKGYDDGTFRPNRVITRAEMAVMLDKALSLPASNRPSNYKDARQIPSWAVQAIRNTKVTGLMKGSDNRFRPNDVANRAEAAAVMANALDYYLQ